MRVLHILTPTGHKPGRNPAAQQSPAVAEVCYPFGRKHGRHRAVKRRDFSTLLGGAAAWPLAARAQQPAVPVIGFLSGRSPSDLVAAFRQGLSDSSLVEGQNVAIEYRWAEGQYDRLPAMAADLVARQVAVIATTGGTASALAAKSATATIPIVFNVTEDPVKAGLVASLNRPGGNATGVTSLSAALDAKRLSLLHDAIPEIRVFAVLLNPDDPAAEAETREIESAARSSGHRLVVLNAHQESEIDAAFTILAQQRPVALIVIAEPFFITRREKIVAQAASHTIPVMYGIREFSAAGGLMSYGIDVAEQYRQMGSFAGKILKGAKPADLPVLQPTKFEFVINLKTAKTLGLTLPSGILSIADEVIE
jgi:putative tryptophan/tyrosine transport system substrate-binding protein